MLFITFVLYVAGAGLITAAAAIIVIDLAARSAVSRPLSASGRREPALALDARPLFAQRTPVLDVASTADGKRLIVLEPSAVAIRQRTPGGDVSDVVESRPVQTARTWPRDLRGRL